MSASSKSRPRAAILDKGARGFGEIIGQVLADDPNGLAAHLVEPLLLGAAEQLALGG